MLTTISMRRTLLVLLPLIILISCKKEVDELPPATQTGAHTFGAKVNGVLWTPQGFGAFPANDLLKARMSGHDIVINASNIASSPNETEFQFTIYNVTAPGVYPFNTDVTHPNGLASYVYYVKRKLTPVDEWMTSSTHTGSVTITRIDDVNRIVSGTFQFNAGSLYNSGVLSVTEGRFDLRIQ
jgi:Family of unknown function (DUF6252)